MRSGLKFAVILMMPVIAGATPGPGALALIASDSTSFVQSELAGTGQFTSVDTFDATGSTPTLSQISGYGYVLAWTDQTPNDGVAFGNLLASYYALGGKHLVVSTYGFSNPWEILGGVMAGSYSALTNVGANGTVSGNLVAVVPGSPIFNGINLSSVVYGSNQNYAHPGLAGGATLLANDGAGIDMIAQSANGVMNVNIWPNNSENNAQFFLLLASILKNGGTATPSVPAIGPVTAMMLIAGLGLLALFGLRRQAA